MIGIYSNLYYPTRWVPLRRRGLGWQKCNKLYEEHSCIASCGIINSKLEVVLDIKGCNLNCKYCWGWKMRYSSLEIRKSPGEVIGDILCRTYNVHRDPLVSKSKYRVGVIRITGNEPTLQWRHLVEVVKILDDKDKLEELCVKLKLDEEVAETVWSSKLIIETNGILIGLDKINLEDLLQIENLEMDIDISFKGVNSEQFEWLSDMPGKLFQCQVKGFVKLFDFVGENSLENIRVNPALGINHSPNYCLWRGKKKYVMDVEIIDRKGRKLDFEDYSREFEEVVLSRQGLRVDEAPFREYYGINRNRARQVVAVVYKGKRYLHTLPSEIPRLE